MEKRILFLVQWLLLLSCFSQSSDTEIRFFTRHGKTYTGVMTAKGEDSTTVHFGALGISLLFSTEQLKEANQQLQGKASKQVTALGDEVEQRLQQQAVVLIGQVLQAYTFPQSAAHQCTFRFSELKGCSLYLFYTTRGYDFVSIDYHIVRVDLRAAYLLNPFGSLHSVKVRKGNNHPVVEISKHTNNSTYAEEQFHTTADWSNQPQYMTDLRLCFIDESQPDYQTALERVGILFHFLCQSCQRKK